ncbi:hypothetical protein FHX34_105668 [Actinoplanes teichomyceticus]|uniref:Uncharacterized protein n=1 Tax=Actinoplanes teichomyceticus TaxID=1867 RepID=A0A561VMH8_ACTTI|nr:hypothetical protein FHX34_105668 [Actinoplanes teichomyceticus]
MPQDQVVAGFGDDLADGARHAGGTVATTSRASYNWLWPPTGISVGVVIRSRSSSVSGVSRMCLRR